MAALAERVARAQRDWSRRRVVVLPDFFLDSFVPAASLRELVAGMKAVHGRGGGNLALPGQTRRIGGNAVNTAYALARLGVRTRLVAQADAVGRALLEAALAPLGVDLGGVQAASANAATVAFEFEDGANVMLSDPGPLTEFGPDDLTAEDWAAIDAADAVVVCNWAQTPRHGTALLRTVLERVRRRAVKVFFDSSDPTLRPRDAHELLSKPQALAGLTGWSMNENEARFFAEAATGSAASDLESNAKALARHLGVPIDAHAADRACTTAAGRLVVMPNPEFRPLRRTGAGDAWNAGNVAAHVLGMEPADRLRVAQGVAGCLLTAPDHVPPDAEALAAWLKARPAPTVPTVTNL